MSHVSRHIRCMAAVLLLLALLLPLLVRPLSVAAVEEETLSVCLPRLHDVGAISAQSAVLIDADSGQILYGKQENERLPMASTTKIMTALCAVELSDVTDVITVSPAAVGVEGSSVYLYEGEQLTLGQLLYALLLESANDAAVAIAIGVAGSVEEFVAYMNQKAEELRLQDTHFENPHGLDAEEHYTTAYDLALTARALLAHPMLRTVVSTRKMTIPLNGTQGVRSLLNHNKLLRNYQGAIGVKTGFTKRSGRCLVSAAERDGLTLIAVTLHAPDDWNDHTRMLDAGFAAYERVVLCEDKGFESLIPLAGGTEAYVMVHNAHAAALTLPRDRGTMHCKIEMERMLWAPVKGNAQLGTLSFQCDVDKDGKSETLSCIPLLSAYGVRRRPPLTLWERFLRLFTRQNQ